jgi:hypothetical protein
MKFSVLISVASKHACYHHVVVVWEEMVIDYASMYTYPLAEDWLRQICGVDTTFLRIDCGYNIFPSRQICTSFENANIHNWGIPEYYHPGISIREYFKFRK